MAKQVTLGATDRTVLVFIPDPASTDGSGKTGLAHTSMTVSGTRVETDNDVVVTDYTASLNALTNLTDAHNDWGWKEVSSTLAPGLYRLDIADAIFASGAWYAVVYVQITSSAASASPIEFELIAYNPLDSVRLGLTALPNAAPDAAGGLPVSDAGGLDLDTRLNHLDADITSRSTYAGADTAGTTTLLSRLSSTRAGYLDNLSGGAVALASQILDAAGIRTAVGLASANLDTQFGLVATASKLLKYFQLLLRKDAAIATDNATELTAINADGGSGAGAYANTTDSVEAIRDRGDSAWATATGFSTLDAAGVRAAVGMASANLDTQLGSLATVAELAKVPKSDGTSTWNATALAAIQSECADALAASDAIGAASVSAAAGAKIADIMLRRTSANIEASSNGDTLAFKSLYGAIAMQTHEKDASSGTSLEVMKADGSTTLATITIDTDAAAEPIVGTGSA